ncbi:MAG: hypothetical protein LC745_07395 [Planctomycetia bacterium]|nr:hypothetical protein [Planctomycetia bacterium]
MRLEEGQTYHVRTATDHYVGELSSVDSPHTVTLRRASWVANTGRLSEFVARGRADGMEVEPVGTVMLHWSAIIPWPHELFAKAI